MGPGGSTGAGAGLWAYPPPIAPATAGHLVLAVLTDDAEVVLLTTEPVLIEVAVPAPKKSEPLPAAPAATTVLPDRRRPWLLWAYPPPIAPAMAGPWVLAVLTDDTEVVLLTTEPWLIEVAVPAPKKSEPLPAAPAATTVLASAGSAHCVSRGGGALVSAQDVS